MCGEGYYLYDSNSNCAKCSLNTYTTSDRTVCNECPAGYACNGTSVRSKCHNGMYAPDPVRDVYHLQTAGFCTPCPAGTWSRETFNDDGVFDCSPCGTAAKVLPEFNSLYFCPFSLKIILNCIFYLSGIR